MKPLDQVDEAFGWDEGEGERTREDWLAQHTLYFEPALRRADEASAFDAPSMPSGRSSDFTAGLAARATHDTESA